MKTPTKKNLIKHIKIYNLNIPYIFLMPGYIEFSNPVPFVFSAAIIRKGRPIMMAPLFSNNSIVYYQKGGLASCGVGTARNCSVKSKRI